MSRLGDSGVHTLGDTSAFVNPAGCDIKITRQNAIYDLLELSYLFS